jgi:hypothetical protein
MKKGEHDEAVEEHEGERGFDASQAAFDVEGSSSRIGSERPDLQRQGLVAGPNQAEEEGIHLGGTVVVVEGALPEELEFGILGTLVASPAKSGGNADGECDRKGVSCLRSCPHDKRCRFQQLEALVALHWGICWVSSKLSVRRGMQRRGGKKKKPLSELCYLEFMLVVALLYRATSAMRRRNDEKVTYSCRMMCRGMP